MSEVLKRLLSLSPDRRQALHQLLKASQFEYPAEWLYEVSWVKNTEHQINDTVASENTLWIILAEEGELHDELQRCTAKSGEQCVWVYRGSNYQELDSARVALNPASEAHWTNLVGKLADFQGNIKLIYLWGIAQSLPDFEARNLDAAYLAAAFPGFVRAALSLMKGDSVSVKASIFTCGAYFTGVETATVDPGHRLVSCLANVLRNEHPELMSALVDLDPEAQPSQNAALIHSQVKTPTGMSERAYRNGQAYSPRLTRFQRSPTVAKFEVNTHGSYLVWGGLGALGLKTARGLLDAGATHVVLTGRSPPRKDILESIEQLRQSGAVIEIFQSDVSNSDDVRDMVSKFGVSLPRLRGIIHAAGLEDSTRLTDLSYERCLEVYSSKVHGALNIFRFVDCKSLDFIGFYSSAAALWGQFACYAAANAFLDAMTDYMRQLGLPALSINLGSFGDVGMSVQLARDGLGKLGFIPLNSNMLFPVLRDLITQSKARAAFIGIEQEWLQQGRIPGPPGFLESLVKHGPGDSEAPKNKAYEILLESDRESQRQQLQEIIQSEAAVLLGLDSGTNIDPGRSLQEYGMSSLVAAQFRNQLRNRMPWIAQDLPLTLAFDYPTVQGLVDFFHGDLVSGITKKETARFSRKRHEEPLAIVGMSCRLPGNIENIDHFWLAMRDGRSEFGEIPAGRWPTNRHAEMGIRRGAYLEDVAGFDAQFFGISPREATEMDPQQRFLLEVVWESLECAGIDPHSLQGTNAALFVGVGASNYQAVLEERGASKISPYALTGLAHSIAAGRIAYTLGTNGPAFVVDLACCSGLGGVHLARKSLLDGETSVAIVAAASVIAEPSTSVAQSVADVLSATGACRPFDAGADGYLRGEGAAAVILKRLSDAERDGDAILALVAGTSIVQSGSSSGLTTPHPGSMTTAARLAHASGNTDPSDVEFVECTALGSAFADAIEFEALASVYNDVNGDERRRVSLGAVKSNIGHLEAASGLAGLIKAVLCVQNAEVIPNVGLLEVNNHINLADTRFRIPSEPIPWLDREGNRMAAVHTFAISGANSHCVVREYEGPHDDKPPSEPLNVLCFSALTRHSLRNLALEYLAYLRKHPEVELGELCFSTNTTRPTFSQRAAVVFADKGQLIRELQNLSRGKPQSNVVYLSDAPDARQGVVLVFPSRPFAKSLDISGCLRFEAFRQALELCQQTIGQELDIVATLLAGESDMDPLHFALASAAVQLSLAKLLEAGTDRPIAVMGEGEGEYVAACFAGALSIEDAFRLLRCRENILRSTGGDPVLLTIESSFEDLSAELSHAGAKAVLVAVLEERRCVVMLERSAKAQAENLLSRAGIKFQVSGWGRGFPVASRAEAKRFADTVKSVRGGDHHTAVVSSLTGTVLNANEFSSILYWRRQLQGALQIKEMNRWIESSQAGTLICLDDGESAYSKTWGADDVHVKKFCFSAEKELSQSLLDTLSHVYCTGASVQWSSFYQRRHKRPPMVPTYPFQHQRYWPVSSETGRGNGKVASHPILRKRYVIGGDTSSFVYEVFKEKYARSGVLWGVNVASKTYLSCAIIAEIVFAAAQDIRQLFSKPGWVLRNLHFTRPVPPVFSDLVGLQVKLIPAASKRIDVEIYRHHDHDEVVEQLGAGVLELRGDSTSDKTYAATGEGSGKAAFVELGQLLPPINEKDSERYRLCSWVESVRQCENRQCFVHMKVDERYWGELASYVIHPGVLEVALEVSLMALKKTSSLASIVGIGEAVVYAAMPRELSCNVEFLDDDMSLLHMTIVDANHRVVAHLSDVRLAWIDQQTAAAEDIYTLSRSRILSLPEQARMSTVVDYLQRSIAKILGLKDFSVIDSNASLLKFGLDSLAIMEVGRKIEQELQVRMSVGQVLGDPTLEGCARYICTELKEEPDGVATGNYSRERSALMNSKDAEALLENVDDLSPEEVEDLIGQLS